MKNVILLLCVVGVFSGCLAARAGEYLPYGKPVTKIGAVAVQKFLKYGGSLVKDEMVVQVDEYGNTLLLVGEGLPDEVAVYLGASAKRDLVENLAALKKLGDKPDKKGQEKKQFAGYVVTSEGAGVSSQIRLNYSLDETGKPWACLMELAGFDIHTTTNPTMIRPSGGRTAKVLLAPAMVEVLITLLEQPAGKNQRP